MLPHDDSEVPGAAAPGTSSRPGPTRRAILVGVAAVAVGALLVGGGWLAATAFVAPRQLEAAATPSPAPPLTASIERGDLDDVRTFAGSVVFAAERRLPLSPPSDAGRTVVTELHVAPGSEVAPGTAVLSVNDAPVFLMESPFAFFRDLGPGDRGADVGALQSTLVAAGLLDEVDGVFGPRTANAVRELFERAGRAAPTREAAPRTPTPSPSPAAGAPPAPEAPRAREVYLPLSAVLACPLSPAFVAELPAVGDLVDATSAVSVASADVVVRAALFDGVSASDVEGATVDVQVAGGPRFSGLAAASGDSAAPAEDPAEQTGGAGDADAPTGAGAAPPTASPPSPDAGDVVVRSAEAGVLARSLVGRPATLSVSLSRLAEDALLVPRSAVAEGPDQTGTILIRDDEGFAQVEVRVRAALGGRVAIEGDSPLLAEGAEVRIR